MRSRPGEEREASAAARGNRVEVETWRGDESGVGVGGNARSATARTGGVAVGVQDSMCGEAGGEGARGDGDMVL